MDKIDRKKFISLLIETLRIVLDLLRFGAKTLQLAHETGAERGHLSRVRRGLELPLALLQASMHTFHLVLEPSQITALILLQLRKYSINYMKTTFIFYLTI